MSGSGNMKGLMIVAIIMVGLIIQGCRFTALSWGSKSEPDKISMLTMTETTTFPNSHVEFTDCVPIVEAAEGDHGWAYVPLAPTTQPPATGRPSGFFGRVIVKVDINKLDRLIAADTCRGMITGKVAQCPTTIRNQLPTKMQKSNIDELPLLEFERTPSLAWGLGMMIGGVFGLGVLCFAAMKSSGD